MRIELRNDSVLLDGYVNAVARDSRNIPQMNGKLFKEQVVPKTFQRALEKAEDVELLLNHDKNKRLGSIKDGNLELFEDNIGLRAICTVTDADIIKKAKNNELRGWSFGFFVNKDKWEDLDDGTQRRYLEEIDLTEVSIVDNTRVPAYIGTSIEKRANEEKMHETRTEDFKAVIEKRNVGDELSTFYKELELLKLK